MFIVTLFVIVTCQKQCVYLRIITNEYAAARKRTFMKDVWNFEMYKNRGSISQESIRKYVEIWKILANLEQQFLEISFEISPAFLFYLAIETSAMETLNLYYTNLFQQFPFLSYQPELPYLSYGLYNCTVHCTEEMINE